MRAKKELEKRIGKEKQHVADLELQLSAAKSFLSGLQESMKIFEKGESDQSDDALREGSDLAKTRELIRKAGIPLHINKILEGIGKEISKPNRANLAGSLSGYARKQKIFTRTAPNTFGLIELDEEADDVGVMPKVEDCPF